MKEKKDIRLSDMNDLEKNFIINSGVHRIEEDVLTESKVKELMGGTIGAVNALLEDIFVPESLYNKIIEAYRSVQSAGTEETIKEAEQIVLANATFYKVSFQVIKEAMTSGKIVYLNLRTEEIFKDTAELMNEFSEEDGLSFMTIHIAEGKPIFKIHVLDFSKGKLVTDAGVVSEEVIGWLTFDYKKYFKLEKEE